MRLGHKYDIKVVLDAALRRLYYEYPLTISEYDRVEHWSMIAPGNIDSSLIDIANLARDAGILSVLPTALYGLQAYDLVDIMRGVRRQDQSIATLSQANEKAIFAASHTHLRVQAITSFKWLKDSGHQHCCTGGECDNGRSHLVAAHFFPIPDYSGLDEWQDSWLGYICDDCVAKAKVLHTSGRAEYWNELPAMFGLPTWAELKNERISPTLCVLYVSNFHHTHMGFQINISASKSNIPGNLLLFNVKSHSCTHKSRNSDNFEPTSKFLHNGGKQLSVYRFQLASNISTTV